MATLILVLEWNGEILIVVSFPVEGQDHLWDRDFVIYIFFFFEKK